MAMWTTVPGRVGYSWRSPLAPACWWHIPVQMQSSARARCIERPMPNGDLLALRGVVDAGGIRTIDVVLINPDRSGVESEAGNWPMAALANRTPLGQVELPTPRVTRPDTAYTIDQLARVVRAVMRGHGSASRQATRERDLLAPACRHRSALNGPPADLVHHP
jgi:hypothetical protein